MSLLYSSTCFEHNRADHQEVKIVSHSIWHRHTETDGRIQQQMEKHYQRLNKKLDHHLNKQPKQSTPPR